MIFQFQINFVVVLPHYLHTLQFFRFYHDLQTHNVSFIFLIYCDESFEFFRRKSMNLRLV
jgi:hypothetical protein